MIYFVQLVGELFMKAPRPLILESSLLCLLLFAQGCSHNHPEMEGKVLQQKTIEYRPNKSVRTTGLLKGQKKMAEMTVEEARKVLQDAEQVLAETKNAVELAKKKHMTLEEMLSADVKAGTAYHSVRLIPASLFVAGNDFGERYSKLILDLAGTRNKLITVIDTEVDSATHDLIKRTGKTETKLRSNLESIKKVIDRYPAPDLVKLKDTIAGKLEAVKQVSSEPVEQAIKRIKEELKDGPHYV
ncbi:hypothetical protein, partial [Candidatus Liberibacter solanacearum]|uniref:hypothetical protein n=1 Tax=Candidatus Liberibacter solanacearum TaxID=556287 RepID=UPI00387DCDBA